MGVTTGVTSSQECSSKERLVILFREYDDPEILTYPLLKTTYQPFSQTLYASDYLIITSQKAIDALNYYGVVWQECSIIAVGAKSAHYCQQFGARKIIQATNENGEGVATLIREQISKNATLIYPSAKEIASHFHHELEKEGYCIKRHIVYKTECQILETKQPEESSVYLFTSPKIAHCFLKQWRLRENDRIVCIGKTTAEVFKDLADVVIPKQASLEAALEVAKGLTRYDQ